MTTPPPPAEPTTAALVAEHLKIDPVASPDKVEALEPTVAAVCRFVRRLHDPLASGEWAADHKAGALLLAARLWRRRLSPDGVATFTAEGGAVYVQRNDPDVAMYLGLGAYAAPVVG